MPAADIIALYQAGQLIVVLDRLLGKDQQTDPKEANAILGAYLRKARQRKKGRIA